MTEAVHEPHEPHLETGLCVNTWCNDAALPDEEFCRDCYAGALEAEAELLTREEKWPSYEC